MRGRRSSAVEKRKTLTTKAQRHQGKIHREDGEVREKRFHHKGHRGHEGKMFTTEAQRHREALREKMQGPSAKVTEERGQWLVDYPSLI